uniref:Uncharacterized protein n=1 Tax=Magnetococcus massalia (strain MO-1) TaxID=451514 RepID=A0A1S7LE04_MAGMO|nr:protein of unknown function [Candidatus Magnetococcus massalia]
MLIKVPVTDLKQKYIHKYNSSGRIVTLQRTFETISSHRGGWVRLKGRVILPSRVNNRFY